MIDLRDVRLVVVDGRSLSRAAMRAALEAEPDLEVVGAAATVSAPAMAKRADTPERWSTAEDSRRRRVNRARVSRIVSGTSAISSA